jgi:hypothetical protein
MKEGRFCFGHKNKRQVLISPPFERLLAYEKDDRPLPEYRIAKRKKLLQEKRVKDKLLKPLMRRELFSSYNSNSSL